MKVSPEQVKQITEVIQQSSITIESLKDDLVDHICCVVEYKISKGDEFSNF